MSPDFLQQLAIHIQAKNIQSIERVAPFKIKVKREAQLIISISYG